MIEQLFFIVVSVCLFGVIFYQMIRENETGYITFLVLQALGIIIDAIRTYFFFENKYFFQNDYIFNFYYTAYSNLCFKI